MAKAPPKKKAAGASRNAPAARKPAPGWLWLLTGFVTAAFVFFLVHLYQGRGSGKILALGADSTATSGATQTSGNPQDASAATSGSGAPTHYDFYTLLPNQKVIPSKAAVDAGNKTAASVADNNKQPLPSTAAVPGNNTEAATALPVEPKPAEVIEPRPPKVSYFLQAGSFRNEAEADRRRASIILLGLPVKTEHILKDNQTWFRVVVGPLASKEGQQSAKESLKGNGIDSVNMKQG